MFHLRDGLFFARSNATDVCIIKTTDGKMPWRKSRAAGEPFDTNIVFELTVPENEWASVVCSVSVDGENHGRWMRARRFHGTDLPFAVHELKDAIEAPLTPEQREWMDAPMGPPRPSEISLKAENELLKKHGRFTRERYTGFGENAQDCTCCGAIQNGHGGLHAPGCALAKILYQPESIVKDNALVGVKLNNADGTETLLTLAEYDARNPRYSD